MTQLENGAIQITSPIITGNTKRRFDAKLSDTLGPDGEYGVVIVRVKDELER